MSLSLAPQAGWKHAQLNLTTSWVIQNSAPAEEKQMAGMF